MHFIQSFDSEIRFPKKKSTAEGFEEVLARHEKSIIDSYRLTQTEDEIWVTEQVNNLLFTLIDKKSKWMRVHIFSSIILLVVIAMKISCVANPTISLVLWYFYIWFLYGIINVRSQEV